MKNKLIKFEKGNIFLIEPIINHFSYLKIMEFYGFTIIERIVYVYETTMNIYLPKELSNYKFIFKKVYCSRVQ